MRRFLLLIFLGLLNISVFAQVDYASEIQPILANNCNNCHSGGGSGFDSSPYEDLIASMSSRYNSNHIIPGEANNSPLVDKIEPNPQFGTRMPQGGQLTTNEINKIKQWINEGANEQVQTSNEVSEDYPDKFELLGNYPNPFNPSTVVQFRSPVNSNFQVTLYNANGQLVNTLNGRAKTGLNDFPINLSNQPSGVYFYRIKSISNTKVSLIGSGKMTLIK